MNMNEVIKTIGNKLTLWALYVLAMRKGVPITVLNAGLDTSEEDNPIINELSDEIDDMDGLGNDSLHIIKE